MKKTIAIIIINAFVFYAQTDWMLGGYVQNLQTVWKPKKNTSLFLNGSVVNRINASFYYGDMITINMGLRNIIDYGNFNTLIPGYSDLLTETDGYYDLNKKWDDGNGYTIYSEFDRLNLYYTNNDFEFQIGRQRVNLGMNLVWTPNDIFNSTSFLNFSYMEKQGSDAVRAQYFLGYASSVEIVYKLDYEKEVTAAAIVRLNNWDYDFQFIAGEMKRDYVLGFGYAGEIKGAGFYGEATYFIDKEKFPDTSGVLVAAVSGNYTFDNSVFIHGEFLYNSAGATENIAWNYGMFSLRYNAKNLSPSKYSVFGEISYPVTPLLKIDLSTIINPLDKSFFISPNADFSLSDNTDLLILGQFFVGKENTEWGGAGSFYYMQLKWSF